MRRHRRRAFGSAVVVSAMAVVTLGLAGPSFADTASPVDVPSGDTTGGSGPTGPEQTAQWQAMQTGLPVVVDALTDHLHYYTGTGTYSPGFSGHTDVSGPGWTTDIADVV